MPVYEPKDYEQVIDRIKDKIKMSGIKMGDVLSEEDIIHFEERCNVKLPQAYRIFLKEIGNGCRSMINGFRLNRLSDIEQKDLSRPFMLEKEWIWDNDDTDRNTLAEMIETKAYNGEIELINVGCCMSYNLIVTGKCRGEVWNFADVGVQPCCERQDFLGWFELWLDEQNEVDYFKDFIYE